MRARALGWVALLVASTGPRGAAADCGTFNTNCKIDYIENFVAFCTPVGCADLCDGWVPASGTAPCSPPSPPSPPPSPPSPPPSPAADADDTALVVVVIVLAFLLVVAVGGLVWSRVSGRSQTWLREPSPV